MGLYDDMLEANQRTSKYDQQLADDETVAQQQAAGALAVGSRQSADRNAEVINIATRTKIPAETVSRNLDQLRTPRVDYDKLFRETPHLGEWISNPENASIAHDDMESMSAWERMLQHRPGPQQPVPAGAADFWSKTYGPRESSFLRGSVLDQLIGGYYDYRARSATFGAVQAAEEARTGLPLETENKALMARLQTEEGRAAFKAERLESVGALLNRAKTYAARGQAIPLSPETVEFMQQNSGKTVWQAFRAAPARIIVELGARSGVSSLAMLGSGVALGTVGSTAGPLGATAGFVVGSGGGSARLEYAASIVNGLSSRGVNLNDPQALATALGDEALMETVHREALIRSAAIGGLDAVAALVGTRSLTPAFSSAIARELTNIGVQMPAQAILGATGEALGEVASGQAIQPGEIAAEAAGEFVTAPVDVAAAVLAGTRGSQFMVDRRRAGEAMQRQKVFEAMGSQDSKVRARVPSKFREFVAKATENGPVENVYIPADRLVAYFQAANIDPAEVLKPMPLVAAQLEEALASGTDLQIPMADFATYIAPSRHYAELSKDVRFNPEEMTVREAETWQANADTLGKELEKAASLEAEKLPPGDRKVYEDVVAQLAGTGMEKATAERNATLFASVFKSLGERVGEDPMALYERYGFKVQRGTAAPGQDEVARIVADDNLLTPIIEKLRTEAAARAAPAAGTASMAADAVPTPVQAAAQPTAHGELLAEKPAAPTAAGEPARAAPAISAGPAKGIAGGQGRVRIGEKYEPVQWAVMDAATLEPTFQKAENQYRDRNRAAGQAQVRIIAAGIDFEQLGHSPLMDYGAPTLAPDGRIVGGNGRLAAIRMAYEQGTGGSYREPLIAKAAEFGLSPADIEGMERPVLVRILDQGIDVKAAAIASNEGGALQMSALETAKVDAERIGSLADFEVDDSGQLSINRSMTGIRRWVGALPAQQRGAITDAQGALSAEGVRRLQYAILYRAYGDSPTLARLIDSVDPGSRNIAAALMRAAPGVAELRDGIAAGQRYPLDPSQDIQDAVEKLIRIRESGQSVEEALGQGDIFGKQLSDEAEVILRFMGANLRSSRTIGDFLGRYLAAAERAGSPQQGDLLGDRQAPDKLKLLDEAAATTTPAMDLQPTQSGQLFQEPAMKPWQQYLDEWTPEPTLTPEQKAIESRFMAWIMEDPERAVADYAKLEDAEGGKVISADVARELSPDYLADRSQSVAVQEPASALTKALYAKRLTEPLGVGEKALVLFSAGGMGAGKTSGIKRLLSKEQAEAHIIFDSNMGNFKSGMTKINQAFNAATPHTVLVVYTDRDLENAFRVGFLGRAHRQEEKYGTGRTAGLDVFLETHFSANKANREFAAHLADDSKVEFLYIINEVDRSKTRLGTLAEIHKFDDFTYNSVRERLVEIVAEEAQAGRISESIRSAVLRSEIPRSRSQVGAGDRGESQAQRDGGTAGQDTPDRLIADAIRRSGIDIQTATPEQVRAAIADAQFQQSAIPTDTPAFAKWFGDSKVVDENGEPLVVYHGADADISSFNEAGAAKQRSGRAASKSYFFTSSQDTAGGYAEGSWRAARGPREGANVLPVYLALEKPLVIDADGQRWDNIEWNGEWYDVDELTHLTSVRNKHDGIIIKNLQDNSDMDAEDTLATTYVAFDSRQIKSAIGNVGAFDPATANILHQAAYHGSPHEFDRFSIEKIGSGEGAQVYGWGLYFAENPDVAQQYAKAGESVVEIDGKKIDARMTMLSYDDGASQAQRYAANAVWRHKGDKWAAIADLSHRFNLTEEKAGAEVLRNAKEVKLKAGSIYQVEIPDAAIDRMLVGDELLGRQPPAVLRAIRKIAKNAQASWTGFDAYEAVVNRVATLGAWGQYGTPLSITLQGKSLEDVIGDLARDFDVSLKTKDPGNVSEEDQARILSDFAKHKEEMKFVDWLKVQSALNDDSPKLASQTLNELGIPGIKYLDQGSRGAMVQWSDAARPAHYAARTLQAARRVYQENGGDIQKAIAQLWKESGQSKQMPGFAEVRLDAAKALEKGDIIRAKGTNNLVVFDDSIVEITHKDGSPVTAKERAEFLQSTLNEGPRGSTTFGGDRTFTISLFETADLSTLLHESGHFYLEVLRDIANRADAPQQIRDDMETFLKWAGVDGGLAVWNTMTIDQQRPFHEQFARGFEAYLMEGKAPNAELQSLFARFRAWLVSIYRSIDQLNVKLNDQVRGVFDRLVATDDEIKAAQEAQNYVELFPSAEAGGYSPEEFVAYKEAVRKALLEGEERLTHEVLGELTREQKAKWKEERDQIVTEVTAEAYANPVYRALAFLQRGKNPDRSDLVGIEPLKLNRAALIDQYGKDFLKTLPRPYVYAAEGGAAPDVIASMFGFDSGDVLVQALVGARPMREAIETTADERMRARHGELLLDGTLPEKAMDAVHNDRRADLLASELKALRRLANRGGRELPARDMAAAQARREASSLLPDQDERRVITSVAERVIAARKVRDIRPALYRFAEAKASSAAFDAATKRDYETAYLEKRKQLLNHELYRAAANARDDIERIREYMRGFESTRKRAALGKSGSDYLEQIDDLMTRFDFRRLNLRAGEKRLALAAWVEERRKTGMAISLPGWMLDESNRMPYKELTYEQLQGVHDAVVNINHLAGLKNRLLANEEERNLDDAVDGVVSTIDSNHTRGKVPFEFAPSLGDKIKHGMKLAFAQHTKMEFLFNWLDGNISGLGPVWRTLFKPFAVAEADEQRMQRESREAIATIFARYTKQERWAMFHRRFFADEIGQSMNKATLLAVALNVGNRYNREVLLKGYKWTDPQLRAVLARLEDRDWETVQMIWDHLESFWPAIRDLQKDLSGLAPAKVEATPFQSPTRRNMRGGYYPIIYDSQLSWRQHELDETAAVTELYGGAYLLVQTRHGHTEARTNSGGKAIKLDLSVMGNHVVNVIHDLTHRRALLDVDRLVTDDRVREAIEQTAGREMYQQLRPWLKNIAADFKPNMTVVEGMLNHLRAGGTVVAMGIKMTTALVQPLGYFQTSEVLGPKYSAIGLREVYAKGDPVSSLVKAREFAFERSEQIRNRMHTFDRDVRDAIKGMTAMGKEQALIRRGWFFFTGLMDMSVALPTWMGAYRKAMDGEAEGILAGDEIDAIAYADSILRITQSSGAAKDLAMIQATHPLLKVFTTFYSYFNVLFNLFARRFQMTNFRKPADYPRFVASMVVLWFIPGILSEIVAGRGPDDDEPWDEYLKRSANAWAFYPFQSIAFVRDIVTAMGPYGYDGPPAVEAIAKTGETIALLGKPFQEDSELSRSDVKDAVLAVSYWGHLPGRQMWITGSYLYDWSTGLESPDNAAEIAEGLAFARKR